MMLIIAMVVIAGCGTVASPPHQATAIVRDAQGTATAIVRQANQVAGIASPIATTEPPRSANTSTPTVPPSVTPSNTPAPTETATATPLPTDAPIEILTLPSGDAANGEVLFNMFQPDASFACSTCHMADSEDRLIGPGLLNIGTRAEGRVDGLSAPDYILQSIIDPSAYVVADYPDQLMPQNWAEIYSESEIDDIVAYLLTLGN